MPSKPRSVNEVAHTVATALTALRLLTLWLRARLWPLPLALCALHRTLHGLVQFECFLRSDGS